VSFPILNAGFCQIGVSMYTQHDQYVPPFPPIPPVPLPAVPGLIEGPAFMGWPPGFLVHSKQPTVMVDGNPGINQGHDVGYLIPHFAIPMNALCAVHTIVSKHKIMIPVSKVHLKGKPAGTYMWFLLGLICAAPVSLPTGVVLLIKCTVWTSGSVFDVFIGVLYIGLEIGFDMLFRRFFRSRVPAPFSAPNALCVLGGHTLFEALTEGGARLVGRYVLSATGNAVIQHIVKSWIVAPLVRDLPRGKIGIGRGRLGVTFFDGWW
jgi:hypothetical protein